MALDSAVKRRSVINIGSPWRAILPAPDGEIERGDRQVVMFLAASPLVHITITPQPPTFSLHRWRLDATPDPAPGWTPATISDSRVWLRTAVTDTGSWTKPSVSDSGQWRRRDTTDDGAWTREDVVDD